MRRARGSLGRGRGRSQCGLPVLFNPAVNGFDSLVAVAVDAAARRVLDAIKPEFHELFKAGFDHAFEVVQNAGHVASSRGASPIGRLRGELD